MKIQSLLPLALLLGALQALFQSGVVGAPSNLFRVGVETEKATYLKGEPVSLILSITYVGGTVVEVPHPLDGRGYREDLEFSGPGQVEFKRLISREEAREARVEIMRTKPRLVRFEPNVKVARTNWFQCWHSISSTSPTGPVFAEPGVYTIRASVSWQGMTNTATTQLTIAMPASPSDQEAYEWLEKSGSLCQLEYLWDVIVGPNEYREQAIRFRELKQKYPDSRTPDTEGREIVRFSVPQASRMA